ncbi:septum formation initiator family protein, partial [Escherichia coli]
GSKLTLGETDFSSNIFDGFSYTGAAQQATNAKLKARNDQLFAEIDDLNGGQEALEERARNELSMTRPGETFYRLVPDASKRAQSAGQNNR